MKVLSTTSRMPRALAMAAILRMSAIFSVGLVGVSIQISLVFGRSAFSSSPSVDRSAKLNVMVELRSTSFLK